MRSVVAVLLVLGGWGSAYSGEPGAVTEGRVGLEGRAVLAGEGVRLYLPAGMAAGEEHRRLVVELERAVEEMAPRVPVVVDEPLTVAVESDYPVLARATGRLEPAVATGVRLPAGGGGGWEHDRTPPAGAAEVHLVWHRDDLYAVRHAVARALLVRAGLAERLPPWLERGAALWLSGEWYGRPYREWLPALARAKALPEAADLLVSEEQRDGSAPLWTPAAAAVVAALGGETVAEKLARLPGEAGVRALLWKVEREALAAAGRATRSPAVRRRSSATPFFRGISLAMLNRIDGGYHAPSVDLALERLAGLGADAVALMPFAYQPYPRRPEMAFLNRHPSSETDAGVVHAARRARARGFAVLWKPHLWISHGSWAGEVEMSTQADWAAWWRSYRRYVLHHAFLAAWSGAEALAVGVELDRTLGREREWRELIAAVRELYPGALTYAANWYGGAEAVGFWDALDYAGVDAYYPLAASPDADAGELAAGAREVVARLAGLAAASGRPVLLTEVGFAARRAAWTAPHEEGGERSEGDQAAAYRALLEALGTPRWLAGAFFWKAFSAPEGHGGRADFRFLGRSAEDEVRCWLGMAAAHERM